jgi:hypothetical protein
MSMTEIPPADGSLAAGANAFASLFSKTPETQQAGDSQPEQPSAPPGDDPAGAAAPTQDGSEQASQDTAEPPDSTPAQPETYTVKVDGKEVTVTRDELVKGYSRTADYTRKAMELAEQRRKFEAEELTPVRTQRQQYLHGLEEVQKAIEALTPKEPDWQQLRQSAPPEVFAAAWAEWDQRAKQLAQITAERDRVKALEAQDAEKGFRAYVQTEHAKLAEVLPDWQDTAKGPALKKELSEFAKSRGFTDEELGQVYDHRLVVLLHDAYQGHKAKVKAPEIKQRVENVLESPRPGANTQPVKSDAAKDAMKRLRETGRVEDAANAFAQIFK